MVLTIGLVLFPTKTIGCCVASVATTPPIQSRGRLGCAAGTHSWDSEAMVTKVAPDERSETCRKCHQLTGDAHPSMNAVTNLQRFLFNPQVYGCSHQSLAPR